MLPSLQTKDGPLTIGILGGGQLAKMLASAAYPLGLRVAVIEHGKDSPAGIMTQLEFPGGWQESEELDAFVSVCDVITLENEFIDPDILDRIAERRPVFPTPHTMRLVQDKYTQKMTMRSAGIPTPQFENIDTAAAALAFAGKHGFPYILKKRKYGYDGYGNATCDSETDIDLAFRKLKAVGKTDMLMAEEFVRFSGELAVMVARNRRGELAVYPCVETVQRNHICHEVIAPARIDPNLQRAAQDIAVAAVEAVEGVGIFGVELFWKEDGSILFNEIAPRTHNSGHYTIEGCVTSQFENCIRAVCNLPLGAAELVAPGAAMVNLLGVRNGSGLPDSVVDFFRHPQAKLHLYGKKDSRIGRKMGHVTALGASPDEALATARSAVRGFLW